MRQRAVSRLADIVRGDSVGLAIASEAIRPSVLDGRPPKGGRADAMR
jgi:hypothetical protein